MDDPMADVPRPAGPAPLLGEAMPVPGAVPILPLPGAVPTSSPTGLVLPTEQELAAAQRQFDQVVNRVDAGIEAGEVDEVVAMLDENIRTADAAGPSLVAAHAAHLRADVLWMAGRPAEARKAARDAMSRAERLGKPALAATSRVLAGCACLDLERHQEAVEFLDAAVPALPADDTALRSRAVHALGRALLGTSEPATAAARFAEASELAEQAGDLPRAAEAARDAGDARWQLGEPAVAAAAYARAAGLCRGAGAHPHAVRLQRLAAEALGGAGQTDDALAALDEAAAIVALLPAMDGRASQADQADVPRAALDPAWHRAEIDDLAARILAHAGRAPEALTRARAAEAAHLAAGYPDDASCAAVLTANLLLQADGDPVGAEAAARRGVTVAEDDGVRELASSTLAEALRAQGRDAEANAAHPQG